VKKKNEVHGQKKKEKSGNTALGRERGPGVNGTSKGAVCNFPYLIERKAHTNNGYEKKER